MVHVYTLVQLQYILPTRCTAIPFAKETWNMTRVSYKIRILWREHEEFRTRNGKAFTTTTFLFLSLITIKPQAIYPLFGNNILMRNLVSIELLFTLLLDDDAEDCIQSTIHLVVLLSSFFFLRNHFIVSLCHSTIVQQKM